MKKTQKENLLSSIIKEILKRGIKNKQELNSIKREISNLKKLPCPSNFELLRFIREKKIKISKKIEKVLRVRPVRSLSGIVNVSVLTKPYPCPGECIYCPKVKGIPKSYLKEEPAVMRAKRLNYNPFLQVKKRIQSLEIQNHPTEKIELRIIGGTWSFYPKKYREWFVKRCFDGCNKTPSKTLVEAQRKNEKSKHKIVGISIETRPDFIDFKEIKHLRELGITRVEIGVQTIFDDILKIIKRGHNVESTIEATRILKDAGFKVCYQMMLNLPGSSPKKDEKIFEELFENPNFRPDLLKIYPLALVKEARLYEWWKKGKVVVYNFSELKNLLINIKKKIPYYVRIQRIVRDIPAKNIIEGGAKVSNLRQIISKEVQCKCIRCREVRENYNPNDKLYLFREDYEASKGKEIFLSFETKDRKKLYSMLRLRIPSFFNPLSEKYWQDFPYLKQSSAIIREVHTFGQLQPLKTQSKEFSPQHKGLGKKLIEKAEEIAKKEFKAKYMSVISGVGVRDYYRKLGYRLQRTYMVKKL